MNRALVLVLLVVIAAPAGAADHCGVKQARDGTIYVKASNIVGSPQWGSELGQETNSFDNAASCVASGRVRGCTLAAIGMPERTSAPATCTVFVKDASGQSCSAYLRKCIPTPLPIPCPMFPANNVWNADISALPVHSMSDAYVASIGTSSAVHPDFGSGLYDRKPIGIPYTLAPAIQPLIPISFLYSDESDPGPYPISPYAPIEGGAAPGKGYGDRHVLIVETGTCTLYEVYRGFRLKRGTSWAGDSGAVFDLNSNDFRPDTWTSADAAGLPILPGLARFDEVESGVINHALRFTAPQTQRAYIWPARHYASSQTDPNLPPMGIRARLKASFDISSYSAHNQVILTALKKYGMFLADNGSAWFISGAPDPRWDNDDLHHLQQLHGSDFEIVDESSLMVDPDSGQVP